MINAKTAVLLREASVWSAATGNGLNGELADFGYLGQFCADLNDAAKRRVSEPVFKASLALAQELGKSGKHPSMVTFLDTRIHSLANWRYYVGPDKPRFSVRNRGFDTLIAAVEFVIDQVPHGLDLVERGHYFINQIMPVSSSPQYADLFSDPAPEAATPQQTATMKVDLKPLGLATVKFSSLKRGETFLYAGRLYIVAAGVITGNQIATSNGRVTEFGVDLSDGAVNPFVPDQPVTPVEAEVTAARFARTLKL